ncbi:peptidylprolyl isomerase [Candidatus Pelagibacter sp.]|jgi:peptidyl-prolyl cis-trans isomerase SurA|nr:peptidylprolyl isomerase [Candidatus Pelagibacter sp.]
MIRLLIVIFLYLTLSNAQSIETKIVYNIQNEIITNVDVKNEFKYLLALNNNLKELSKEKILNISNTSIIREKIKKIEILKNFKQIKINDEHSSFLLKNTYSRLGLKSLDEFELYLKEYGLTLDNVKEKIIINALWNQLIYIKYGSQVTVNEEKIKKKIIKDSKSQSKEYQLSEIIFDIKNREEIQKKYREIIESINEIGFKNTASIYSFSDSAKIGGDIGWVNENSLNNRIKDSISNLNIGEASKPIILSNGVMILMIIDKKTSDIKIDHDIELEKAINYEKNRQLSQYSKIYFNKVKKNLEFNE